MLPVKLRNTVITIFVILWTILFHYESIRYFYLEPLTHKSLPQTKFLFPPAGWIMFFNVDDTAGFSEVYGVVKNQTQFIDPHLILTPRPIGYDNVHRNALTEVLMPGSRSKFCGYLHRKFPDFDKFYVVAVQYPSLTKKPQERLQKIIYECKDQ